MHPRRTPGPHSEFEAFREVVRDMSIYRNDNWWSMWRVQGAAIVNFFIWIYLVTFAVYYLRTRSYSENVDEKLKKMKDGQPKTLWEKMISFEAKHRWTLGSFCALVGVGGVSLIGLYATKSVNQIVIRPKIGSNIPNVKLQTYSFLPSTHVGTLEVPLSHISCVIPRNSQSRFVTIKVKGRKLYYLIDKDGTFLNPYIFDRTIGLSRNLERST
jgi:uncharacterized SAM-binding protein YcdF (DUF218 family)